MKYWSLTGTISWAPDSPHLIQKRVKENISLQLYERIKIINKCDGFSSCFSYQVNSDKIYWKKNLDGTFTQFHIEKKAVGHCISTKAVGSEERADITHLYKHQEGAEFFLFRLMFQSVRIIPTLLKCNALLKHCVALFGRAVCQISLFCQ